MQKELAVVHQKKWMWKVELSKYPKVQEPLLVHNYQDTKKLTLLISWTTGQLNGALKLREKIVTSTKTY